MARKQDENLKPFDQRTEKEQREIRQKGGRASGKARREKADLRKAAQAVLTGTYKDKNGNEITGEELVIKGLIANLAKPTGRNWSKSMDILMDLTDSRRSAEERERMKAETELTLAKIKIMQGGDDGAMSKLDEILKELAETAQNDDAKTKPETE